ncbi:NB-ARC domain-containing protein [Saccharopolyspora endophytica]|uniref:Helix-turn-helix domain-containing protein n=1 Tax=Saccharopolyspora endophytica TaxID=543886 RepID=A0ABS5DR79_9PSEU|nr:NB-ARC domain-containing protein [Saccharopolyspora endophytica]MBQ0928811.1 helix-turn-helix domain-containing protein [Saccharopolyspora endophytica]
MTGPCTQQEPHHGGLTEFGSLVVRWCADRTRKQADLAAAAGLSPSYLSKLIRGRREVTDPVITALEQIMHTGGALADAAARSNDDVPARPLQMRRRSAPAQLPATVATLHGRDHELASLASWGPAPGLRLIIDGPLGTGKTTLAVYHARRLTPAYRAGTLFADLRGHHPHGPADPGDVLAELLNSLGLPVPKSFSDRVQAWRSATWSTRLLLVLDDARSTEQITPLLPAGQGCAVLITSRYRLSTLLVGTGTQTLTLTPLRRTHSLALLTTRLGTTRINAEPDIANHIASLCGDLPQALALAAERLSTHPDVPLEKLLSEYEDRWELTEITDQASGSMRIALDAFYNTLPPDHQRAWRLIGGIGRRTTTEQLTALTGWAPCHTRSVLEGLILAHLITRHNNLYEMNNLLASWGAHTLAHDRHLDDHHTLGSTKP